MAFSEDIVDWITSEITAIGLADGPTGGDEVSGGGYVALSPSYTSASGGSADLSATLEFDGPENGTVTHVIFKNSGGTWFVRSLGSSMSFNSDGRFDLTSAEVSNSIV